VFVVSPGRGQVDAFPLEIGEAQAALLGIAAGPLTVDLLNRTLNGKTAPDGQPMPGLLQRFAAPDTVQAETDPIAHALWQILVPEAMRPRLLAAEEVVLIPDEGLHFLPFEALLVEPGTTDSDHQFWLDVGPVIRYAPSLATLNKFAESASSGAMQTTSILSLSNPTFDPQVVAEQSDPPADPMLLADAGVSARMRYGDRGGTFGALPGTARETRAIATAMGQEESALEVIQGVEATEAALRSALPGKRYLHLATHGLVDARPGGLFASLVLTPPPGETSDLANDGFLQLHEIYDLPLGYAELTVLSACETNIGVAIEGEGVFALSRGFLAAGARRVIASQWNVNDASTATLIGAFFEAVFEAEQAGLPVDYAHALRDAKRRVRQEGTWESPFYWAPFILIGSS
jgi:CHAT domain-containing protein